MKYESFVGLRYLMAKGRSTVLSIITLISITGVALGVTALIVVLSVMGGFKKDLMDKILGTKAHIVIRAPDFEDLKDPDTTAAAAREHPRVLGAAPYVEAEVMVSSPTNLSGVILRGVDPNTIGDVSTLVRDMQEGKLSYLEDSSPLTDELKKYRDGEMDRLLERLDAEREELAAEKNAPAETADVGTGAEPDAGADEGFMPMLPHEEFGEAEMPLLPHEEEAEGGEEEQAEGDNDAGEVGEMPALPGDGDADETRLPGLIIGPELAKSLQVDLGDEVNVVTPNAEMGPMGPIPRSRPFRIVGVFYSGMYEYDANFAYTHITDAQQFLSVEGATGIELRTAAVEDAVNVATELQKSLGPSVEVLDWQELNKSLFYALKLEKIAMFVVLTFIILVASFSIVAMLIMIVIEKGREIAILKSMGATDGGVMRTFIFQGLVIGTIGALIGLVGGLGICYFLATVGFPLNSEVYYISTLPVEVDPAEVGAVVVCAIVISLLATIYPSIQAARLNPVDGLRYE